MNITIEALKQFGIGLAITAVITLGAALVNLGPTEDLSTWAHNLIFGESVAVGVYIVNYFRGYMPPA